MAHRLRHLLFLTGHTVKKTQELGWDTFSNGELLNEAERAAFEVSVTTDKNIRYQQKLANRVIAIVVLGNPRLPLVKRYVDLVVAAANSFRPGSYIEVEISDR